MANIPKARVTEYLQEVIRILSENGGSLSAKELINQLEDRLKPNDAELHIYPGGGLRWIKVMQFSSIGLVKAGWIRKKKGTWFLTEEGEQSLKLDSDAFRKEIDSRYRVWLEQRAAAPEISDSDNGDSSLDTYSLTLVSRAYEESLANAVEEIKEYVRKMGPYEFQDLVAALFRGMGYFTPFVAPRGKDGGIDIVAYKDPIGAESPRIRVQVKHRIDTKVSSAEVQALRGTLDREGSIGVIASSGGFSPEAVREIRTSSKHMEKMDLDTILELWEQHYDRLTDEDRQILPLRRISFLAPEE